MTPSKFRVAASLFFALIVSRVVAPAQPLRIRSLSTTPPGQVSAVVELPQGLTPKATDFDLKIDNNPVATVREIRGPVLNIMFLVDVSGSMKGRPLDDTKKALLSFL